MQQMTKEAIKKLQSETSHALDVRDFDLIESLDAIAKEVTSKTRADKRLLNQPYELCGLLFYPLTVAKSLWYAEKCEEWSVEGAEQESLLFWLLTLPNDAEALDHCSLYKEASRGIRRVSRRLHCTPAEMTEVYCRCLGINQTDPEQKGDDATNYGTIIAVLLREYGGTPDQWMYHTSVEMIAALFAAYAEKCDAERGQVKSGGKKKAVAPAPTKRMLALSAFREKVNEIRELWEVSDAK